MLLKQSLLGIVVFYTQKTPKRGEHSWDQGIVSLEAIFNVYCLQGVQFDLVSKTMKPWLSKLDWTLIRYVDIYSFCQGAKKMYVWHSLMLWRYVISQKTAISFDLNQLFFDQKPCFLGPSKYSMTQLSIILVCISEIWRLHVEEE